MPAPARATARATALHLIAALAPACFLLPASVCRADVLLTKTIPVEARSFLPLTGPASFTYTLAPWPDHTFPVTPTPSSPTGFPDMPDELFTGVRFSALSVGQEYRFTRAGSDPDFADFAESLTDARENHLVHTITFYGTGPQGTSPFQSQRGGVPEPRFLFADGAGLPVDLTGHEITAITLRLDALTAEPLPAPNPPYHKVSGSMTLTIEGTVVPEPTGTVLVAGATALTLLGRPRRRRCGRHAGARGRV